MRIGIDARISYYSGAGIGQYTKQLIRALSQVATTDEFTILQSRKDQSSLVDHPRFRRRSLWTPSHHRLEQLTLPLEVALADVQLLHSPDFIPPFRRKCKSVITIHDLAFLLYPNLLTRESARYYSQIDEATRRTDHIIAVSESTKRDIMRLLGVHDKYVTVIHEAADPIYRPLDRGEAAAWVQDRYHLVGKYVLFMSTIEPKKNLPMLLQAFRQMLDTYHIKAKLVVAGDRGWLFEDVFQTVERLKLSEDVIFLGRVTNEELLNLYNAAQVLVHPALYEGFGLTPLEAMACGTPVIVSNASSLPEVVGDAGLLVDPKDPEDLAVAMARVLTTPELQQELRHKGLRRAKNFSWAKAAAQTLELYHRLNGHCS
ncbi:MAG: glycosyltransferase family 4 protein [Chloroflexi bacterium]|nr:glycosyltransferase family 4 protein [Chloroflexota bacterium]